MIKALRVTMIVYAAIGILFGLAYIFVPRQLGAMFGHEAGPEYVAALAAALGVSFVSACIFLIIAARDPLKHILWVKYAIVFAILMFAVHVYSLILGYVNFKQAATDIILHPIFAIALLAFYPWRGR
jgi:hypothetical protein